MLDFFADSLSHTVESDSKTVTTLKHYDFARLLHSNMARSNTLFVVVKRHVICYLKCGYLYFAASVTTSLVRSYILF